MSLQEKSILARLMATENLYIEERSVHTAMFDMKNRVLTVPILDGNISNNIYDLFMGHEVGHALETPADGYHNSVKVLGVNRTILNVCEDVRIEKKIKRKFPGIRYPFLKGYEELLERNFFGIKGVDLNTLNLIDRINLHTKCGASLAISFNEAEMRLLDELEAAETFKEVVTIAKKIQKYMKENKEQPKENKEQQKAERDGEYGSVDSFEEDDTDMDSDSVVSDGDDETELEEKKDAQSTESKTGPGKVNDVKEEDLESITDKNFRKNESKLYDTKNKESIYCNIPDINSDEFIFSYDDMIRIIRNANTLEAITQATDDFKKFRRESDPVVAYLVKEFELRKNAEQQLKVRVSKTGDINTNRIHEYQFSDDIFKRLMNMPNGKSHGLIMLLDWSGSMHNYINQTIRQLLNIVMFCRKANIPHEVYAFSDHHGENRIKTDEKVGDILFSHGSNIRLLNIFSSRMKNAEFSTLASYMLQFRYSDELAYHEKREFVFPGKFQLGGTPLNESLILSFDLIEKFKQRTRADIVNMIVLSDGDGHHLNLIKGVYVPRNGVNISKLVIRDPKTKNYIDTMKLIPHVIHFNGARQRDALVHLLRLRTNSNVLCFHITSSNTAKEKLAEFLSAEDQKKYDRFKPNPILEKMCESFRKQKFYIGKAQYGFSEYYLIRSSNLELEEEGFAEKDIKNKSLVSAFSKYTSSKVQSRVVLNSFIRMIA